MHPREIKIVKDNMDKLKISKVYFKGFYSRELKDKIDTFIRETDYDNYIVTADDVIITQDVLNLIEKCLEKYEVFTGYCNMYLGSEEVNLCSKPLTLTNGIYPLIGDYNFMTFEDVKKQKDIFRTYLAGLSLTGMRRNLWLKYPLQAYLVNQNDIKGVSCDHNLSYRLTKDNVSIYTHKKAYIKHLKKRKKGALMDGWIVGKKPAEIIKELI